MELNNLPSPIIKPDVNIISSLVCENLDGSFPISQLPATTPCTPLLNLLSAQTELEPFQAGLELLMMTSLLFKVMSMSQILPLMLWQNK